MPFRHSNLTMSGVSGMIRRTAYLMALTFAVAACVAKALRETQPSLPHRKVSRQLQL